MKLLGLFVLLAMVATCSSSPKRNSGVSSQSFKLRDYKTESLENGLEILRIDDKALPSFAVGVLVKSGASADPVGKSGLMNLMARTLSRGAGHRSAVEIIDSLGKLGADFSATAAPDYTWVLVGGLSFHQKTLTDIFLSIIESPKFPESEVQRERKLILASLQKKAEDPRSFADDVWASFVFGNHPYGLPSEGLIDQVKKISRKDLMAFHRKTFVPDNLVLVITGDIQPAVYAELKSSLSKWKKSGQTKSAFQSSQSVPGFKLLFVNKPDLTQAQVQIGHVGIQRQDADFLTARVGNILLGGNFSSRLMDRIRGQLGLTYGISSNFDARLVPGPFKIATFTKVDSVGKILDESLAVVKNLLNNGATNEEVSSAKNYLLGMFPRAIETPELLGMNLAMLRMYGISDDYLKNFVVNVQNITTSDVNRVLRAKIKPEDFKVVIMAPESVRKQLSSYEPIEVKSFSELKK